VASTHAFNVSCDLASYRAPPRLFHGGGRPVLWLFGALLWLSIALPAHAQQSPMVQCRIGTFVQVTPDFLCTALMKGATEMWKNKLPPDALRQPDCVRTVLRSLGYADTSPSNIHFGEAYNECGAVFQGMENEYASGHPLARPPVCDCPECRPTVDCVGGKPRR